MYFLDSRSLKSIGSDSLIVCNETTCVMNCVSANTISTNDTSTVSIYFGDKKVRYKMDCYILHIFLFVTMLVFMIISLPLFAIITEDISQNNKKIGEK